MIRVGRVYIYADETGDLGYDSQAPYFGVGTAMFAGDHRDEIWTGFDLRTRLEAEGVRLREGLHAKNDSRATRARAFELIKQQPVRFDSTFLLKEKAYAGLRRRGPVALYATAIELHLKTIIKQVSQPGDEVFFIAGHLQTNAKRDAIYHAVSEVCARVAADRTAVACVWDARSSWGIQVADYGLWSIQRELLGRGSAWHEDCVADKVRSVFRPWEPETWKKA